jgi:hypothetical protein
MKGFTINKNNVKILSCWRREYSHRFRSVLFGCFSGFWACYPSSFSCLFEDHYLTENLCLFFDEVNDPNFLSASLTLKLLMSVNLVLYRR